MKKYFVYSLILTGLFLMGDQVEAATLSKAPNNLSLVGYWAFDEGAGSRLYDSSGNSNTADIIAGTSWVTGKRGGALSFSSGSYAEIPSSSSLDLSGSSFSISMWIKHSGGSSYETILNRGGSGNQKIYILLDPSNILYRWDGFNTNHTIPSGEWRHVVYTFTASDDTSGTETYYVNGVQVATRTGSVPSSAGGAYSLGRPTGFGDHYYGGAIDELRIYKRALTATEALMIYKTGVAKVSTDALTRGIVGYWPMNEGSGTSVTADNSGFGRTASLQNMESEDWVQGKKGFGLDFDSAEYLSVADNDAWSFSGDFSLSIWARWDSFGDNTWWHGAFMGHDNGGGATNKWIFSYDANDPGTVFHVGNTSAGCSPVEKGNAWTPVFGRWYQIGIVKTGTTYTYYRNGMADGTDTITCAIPNPTNPLTIGWSEDGTVTFDGQLDDARIYNRALTANEMLQLYNMTEVKVNASQNNKVANGLVGMWSFNGPDLNSTTAFDRGSGGNNGTLTNGPTIAIGKVGQALSFDGGNDYVEISDHASLTGMSGLTLSTWVYFTSFNNSNDEEYVIMKDGGGDRAYGIFITESNSKPGFIVSDDGSNRDRLDWNTALVNGSWNHLAATWNGGMLRVYLNGVEDNSMSAAEATSVVFNNSHALRIGYGGWGGEEFYRGKIDETRLYSRALSAAEVKQLYVMGR